MAVSNRERATPAKVMPLLNLIIGKWVSQAIGVAADLGIADALNGGTKTAGDVARQTNASEDGIYRLLRALERIGLVVESRGRRFRLTPLGQMLRSTGAQAVGGFARFAGHESTWRPWGELRYSVRTGGPAFDYVFGMPLFEYLANTPESAAVFDSAMTSLSTWESNAVVGAYDFSKIGALVDVAGGHGLMISTILKANRKLRGILFDLPHVTAGAEQLLLSTGIGGRCQVLSGDFFLSVPEGGDAYIMKHIVHDWDDERAIRILQNCHRAMRPGGTLLIVDVVIGSRNSGHYGTLLDLEMLVLTPHGRERTRDEFSDLLMRAGFRLRRVIPTKIYLSIIEAVQA